MVGPQILVDGDVVAHNRSNLDTQLSYIPHGTTVSNVYGDRREHASAAFYTRLKAGAEMVGSHSDVVRAAVKQNAAALKQTVEALEKSDQTSADEATTLTDLVDGTARTTSETTVEQSQETLAAEERDESGAPAPVADDGAAQTYAEAGGDEDQ